METPLVVGLNPLLAIVNDKGPKSENSSGRFFLSLLIYLLGEAKPLPQVYFRLTPTTVTGGADSDAKYQLG